MSKSRGGLSADGGSFRDPAGFVFKQRGTVYRQINTAGRRDFDFFMNSGLYGELAGEGLMVAHEEVDSLAGLPADSRRYKILRPTPIPFITYPYEWCFSQLKAAALLTLEIQKKALARGMILKDASAYNVQFFGRRPIFIDTLSFRIYEKGAPWDGYRQFCEHFVAPLALASYGTAESLRALRAYLDGLPLAEAVALMPGRARFRRGLAMHLYLHAASRKKYDAKDVGSAKARQVSCLAMTGLVSSLERTVRKLNLPRRVTQWGEYYGDTNYSGAGFTSKKKIVNGYLSDIRPRPRLVWDIGANDGTFSELAAAAGAYVVSFDTDTVAIERNFAKPRDANLADLILPAIQDLSNPSPAQGWAHRERLSLASRGPADVVIALALIHHLAISNNLPLPAIFEFLARISRYTIIEFVPKTDSKAKILLHRRVNQFADYTQKNFEAAAADYFQLVKKSSVTDSQRVIYLLKSKSTIDGPKKTARQT